VPPTEEADVPPTKAFRHARGTLCLLLLAVAGSAFADLDGVREQLTRDIQAAQRELSTVQASISRERGALAERLHAAQNRVLDLRERAVAARRLADEETLTLSQLESRIEAWREQSRFQSRLLAGYLDRSGTRPLSGVSQIDLRADLSVLAAHLEIQEARLYPRWEKRQLVSPGGEVAESDLLMLGPVQWFRRADGQVGLVRSDRGVARTAIVFGGSAQAGIDNLYRASDGLVTFDPTLSRALLLAENRETLWEHLRKGGMWVIPILLFAVAASVAVVWKAAHVYRLPQLMPMLAERVESALLKGNNEIQTLVAQVPGPQGELLRIALAERTTGQRDDRLHAALLGQRDQLERWLGAIAITASVSPLLGLLGTVSGMIATFRLMTLFGAGDPSAVSAGISEALVTTELGLVVAIPALLAHALLSRKVKGYFAQLENDALNLSRLPPAGAS
jgi:biopolymer transport protein ExbB